MPSERISSSWLPSPKRTPRSAPRKKPWQAVRAEWLTPPSEISITSQSDSEAERTRAVLQVTLERADGKEFERVAVAPTDTGEVGGSDEAPARAKAREKPAKEKAAEERHWVGVLVW